MKIPKLWIMVGLPASGKTTLAKIIARENNAIIVSSDEIRAQICDNGIGDQSKNQEVFEIYHQRIKECILNGKNVIADATNITLKSRRHTIESIKDIPCNKIAYIMSKNIEKCIFDNELREDSVPVDVILRMCHNFQIPFYEEGFDEIIIHNENSKENQQFIQECIKRMDGFEQKNPHHTMSLYDHAIFTVNKFAGIFGGTLSPWAYFGALLHDIGKVFTQTFDEKGVAHYHCHENVGAYYLLCNAQNFKLRDEEILKMIFLVNYHMLPMHWKTTKATMRWKNRFGENKFELLNQFNQCDKARN